MSDPDREALAAAIAALPEREKVIATLALYEGLTDAEIATLVGESHAAVAELHEIVVRKLKGALGGPEEIAAPEQPIHPVYLPFSERELRAHFAPIAGMAADAVAERHLPYYRVSAAAHTEFRRGWAGAAALPIRLAKVPCQIEKDERFWVVAALMSYFHAPDRAGQLARLMARAFSSRPQLPGLDAWEQCFEGELHLFFEVNLPSPPSYRAWLARNLSRQQLVPYVLDAGAAAGAALEGPTHVDAVLLNSSNGFAVLVEAKVLSDCSCQVTFDARRNQLARNIDVMLEANPGLPEPLSQRDPERTLFALLTPRIFKDAPHSRLYGWLMENYRVNGESLARDLPHREEDWPLVAGRIGWLTWEDCEELCPGACSWVATSFAVSPR